MLVQRATPETDAALIPVNGDYVVWHYFARGLECQRDKAREDATNYFAKIGELQAELDEARNKMADALQEVDLRTLDFERMKQERDEACKEAEYRKARYDVLKESW